MAIEGYAVHGIYNGDGGDTGTGYVQERVCYLEEFRIGNSDGSKQFSWRISPWAQVLMGGSLEWFLEVNKYVPQLEVEEEPTAADTGVQYAKRIDRLVTVRDGEKGLLTQILQSQDGTVKDQIALHGGNLYGMGA